MTPFAGACATQVNGAEAEPAQIGFPTNERSPAFFGKPGILLCSLRTDEQLFYTAPELLAVLSVQGSQPHHHKAGDANGTAIDQQGHFSGHALRQHILQMVGKERNFF